MKTNKFEDTIRRKLESIEPDFQEKDWAKMQNYMQGQSPPTFWQQHSSWIGYAAAASVSTVMAFMYVSQRTQNNHLTADVKKLQHQIEAIKNAPALAQKSDTVYLLKKSDGSGELVALSEESAVSQAEYKAEKIETTSPPKMNKEISFSYKKALPVTIPASENATKTFQNLNKAELNKGDVTEQLAHIDSKDGVIAYSSDSAPTSYDGGNGSGIVASYNTLGQDEAPSQRLALPANIKLDSKDALAYGTNGQVNKMKYNLANRLSTRQYKQALLARNTQTATMPVSGKKTEQVAQAENVVPKLNIKVPYRFGVGFSTDQVGKAKTVSGEVLIAKRFSISAGISWLKVKPMEFFNEKLFREKNRRDFRGTHPGEVPLAFQVYNIKVDPTVVQIPLTVAFRNDIKDNWAYYASAGTNITVSAREKISFDCKAPNFEYFSQHFEAKSDLPVVNSVNFAVGLEKTWYPIVVQAEGYLYTYFNQLTPLSQSAGPGVKVKLMYQIGGKM